MLKILQMKVLQTGAELKSRRLQTVKNAPDKTVNRSYEKGGPALYLIGCRKNYECEGIRSMLWDCCRFDLCYFDLEAYENGREYKVQI